MIELVKCPNGCLLSAGFGKTFEVSRQFNWCEEVDAEIGVRNYCEQCGAELVKANDD